MLVLNRKKEEQIVIGDNIIIRIIECASDHVKIGVEAPKNVSVHRYEVFKAIEAENINAAKNDNNFSIGDLPNFPSSAK